MNVIVEKINAKKVRKPNRGWKWEILVYIPNQFGSVLITEKWVYGTRKTAVKYAEAFCKAANIPIPTPRLGETT